VLKGIRYQLESKLKAIKIKKLKNDKIPSLCIRELDPALSKLRYFDGKRKE
jgi:hypothetical protein